MSLAQREFEGMVRRELFDDGCKILGSGVDGAGHCVVFFEKNGHSLNFHYPSTGRPNGTGKLNARARLRRLLKEVPPPAPPAPEPERIVAPAPPERPVAAIPARRPTPPKPKLKPRDIAKRYIALGSLAATEAETGIDNARLVQIMMSVGGDARHRVEKELARLKMAAARDARYKAALRKLTGAERNKQIAALYFSPGMTAKNVADLFGLAPSTIIGIARRS